jgi:hypothetical protein
LAGRFAGFVPNISRDRAEEDIIKMDMFSARPENFSNEVGNVFEIAEMVSSEISLIRSLFG